MKYMLDKVELREKLIKIHERPTMLGSAIIGNFRGSWQFVILCCF